MSPGVQGEVTLSQGPLARCCRGGVVQLIYGRREGVMLLTQVEFAEQLLYPLPIGGVVCHVIFLRRRSEHLLLEDGGVGERVKAPLLLISLV